MNDADASYQLRVTRRIPNPDYTSDKDYRYVPRPEPWKELESLSVTITSAQFDAIRKAVLEHF